MASGLERAVRLPVVEDIAETVHGVFQDGGNGEDDQAGGRALEGAREREDEAGGLADERQDADGFGGHASWLDVNSTWAQSVDGGRRRAAHSRRIRRQR